MTTVHDQVLDTAKRLLATGLVSGTAGNVSGRLEDGNICVTPSSIAYETMTLDDLVVIDPDGNKLSGPHNPTSEWQLHAHALAAYPELGGVIHAHPVHCQMFAVTRQPIPAVIDEFTIYVGGDVPVADYGASGTGELADNATRELASVGAVLLANHGIVAVGPSLAKALHIITLVERSAQVIVGARRLGDLVPLPVEENEKFRTYYQYMRTNP